ncbi:YkgJ family cysteine cluster protein [bacterium]|nr:YkgJ family cysteine cluster protein [bacterium]
MEAFYIPDRAYFFDRGLSFECQRCGACCMGEPGVILVTIEEIKRIAGFLKMGEENFINTCLYPVGAGYSIKEDKGGRCIFYKDGCSIYPFRPLQCRTYPFWFNNLRSEENWHAVSRECPGIGKGMTYGKEEILECIALWADFIKPG